MAATGWGALAKAIDDDRQRLRLSWSALSRRSGVSLRTLYDLRRGERTSYSLETMDRLEDALHWQHGSIERVVDGRRPQRKPDPDMARIEAAWRNLPPAVRRVLADVAEMYSPT